MSQAPRTAPPEPMFRVLSLQQGDQNGQSGLHVRRYQKRRTHAKSKGGCLGCKVKRVKCDEGKPSCQRCHRSRAPCSYTDDCSRNVEAALAATRGHPGTDRKFLQSTELSDIYPSLDLDKPSSPYGTPRIALLHHFQNGFSDIFFGTEDPSHFITLGLQRPFVLDALLAVSASHLRHHTTSSSYRVAEHFQQSLALRNFQTALHQPFDQQGSDALLLTAMLLNLLNFSIAHEGSEPVNSWVFSTAPDRLDWLILQMGFKPLLMATKKFHDESALSWMFNTVDHNDGAFIKEGLPLTNVPEAWLWLFGLRLEDEDPTPANIFYDAVRILAETRPLPPVPEAFFLYMAVFSKLDAEFRSLLEARDERAVWFLGYWLGLLCRYDFWWMSGRTRRDHRAVVLWLEGRGVRERGGEEGRMWEVLMDDLVTAMDEVSRRTPGVGSRASLPDYVSRQFE